MQRWRVRHGGEWFAGQHGMTLVEALVALALTVTVVTVVTSILFSSLLSQRRLLQQTDDYEALRIAAATFTQDARYANSCAQPSWDELQLSFSESDYVIYRFKQRLPDGSVQADPTHLHRWLYAGGNFQSDEIIGWNLVPPSFRTPTRGTRFECNTAIYNPNAAIILFKPPLPGQRTPTQLRVSSYPRS